MPGVHHGGRRIVHAVESLLHLRVERLHLTGRGSLNRPLNLQPAGCARLFRRHYSESDDEGLGWEINSRGKRFATSAQSILQYFVARTEGYTYTARVWALSRRFRSPRAKPWSSTSQSAVCVCDSPLPVTPRVRWCSTAPLTPWPPWVCRRRLQPSAIETVRAAAAPPLSPPPPRPPPLFASPGCRTAHGKPTPSNHAVMKRERRRWQSWEAFCGAEEAPSAPRAHPRGPKVSEKGVGDSLLMIFAALRRERTTMGENLRRLAAASASSPSRDGPRALPLPRPARLASAAVRRSFTRLLVDLDVFGGLRGSCDDLRGSCASPAYTTDHAQLLGGSGGERRRGWTCAGSSCLVTSTE
jgi:hypothetical protein